MPTKNDKTAENLKIATESPVSRIKAEARARSHAFAVKLAIHNFVTIPESFVFGMPKWISRSDIDQAVTELSTIRRVQWDMTCIHKGLFGPDGKDFGIGLCETITILSIEACDHELLHLAQYLRNPQIDDKGPMRWRHEFWPALLGNVLCCACLLVAMYAAIILLS